MGGATQNKLDAATAVANAEGEKKKADDAVVVAETDLQDAKDQETINVRLANDHLTGNKTEAAEAAAFLVDQNEAYVVAVGLEGDAKAARDRQKPILDNEQAILTRVINTLEGLHHYSSDEYLLEDETSLEKGLLVATLPTLSKGFVVSFDVKANKYINEWQSIVHFSPDDTNGSRQPAIWFNHLSGSLHICSGINGNSNTCYNSAVIARGQWTTVQITQTALGAYSIALNGEEVQTWQNNDAKDYSDVKVYAADPWYTALDGSIRNLKVTLP